MDAGRRPKISRSETEDFITPSTASLANVSIFVSLPLRLMSHEDNAVGLAWMPIHKLSCVLGEEL